MAENEINEGGDKVRISDRTEHTSKHTADEAVSDSERAEGYEQRFTTFSDNSNDQSFKAIQPAADSFGIDFGDGTIETSKGKVAKSSNQPEQLIAANLTPTNPLRSDATLPNLDEIEGSQLPKDATAWDPLKEVKNGSEKISYPHRENPDQYYDGETARYVSQHLPRLAHYSELHDGMGPKLIRAIMRNEQTYYHTGKDGIQDISVRYTGKFFTNASIGPGQIQMNNIKDLQEKYPELFGQDRDILKLATDKSIATGLVGAYLDDRINTMETWMREKPDETSLSKDQRYLYKHAFPLWKAGMHTKALIMSYNPAGGEDHLNNVLRQLKEIDSEEN